MRNIETGNLKATYQDVEYTWEGGFGSIITSYEKGVKRGDVRIIGEHIFYAYLVHDRLWGSNKICWTTQNSVDYKWILEFKQAFFGL